MRPGGSISFEYEWERSTPDEGEGVEYIMLRVEATISDFHPGVRYLRNGDPGYPDEGGGCHSLTATLPDGTVLDPMPDGLQAALAERAEYLHSEENVYG